MAPDESVKGLAVVTGASTGIGYELAKCAARDGYDLIVVADEERITVDPLRYTDDGIVHVEARFGFQDELDLPAVLQQAVGLSEELQFDLAQVSYFLSRLSLQRGHRPGLAQWRKRLFIGLAHNAANPAHNFCLPLDRTVVMGSHLDL